MQTTKHKIKITTMLRGTGTSPPLPSMMVVVASTLNSTASKYVEVTVFVGDRVGMMTASAEASIVVSNGIFDVVLVAVVDLVVADVVPVAVCVVAVLVEVDVVILLIMAHVLGVVELVRVVVTGVALVVVVVAHFGSTIIQTLGIQKAMPPVHEAVIGMASWQFSFTCFLYTWYRFPSLVERSQASSAQPSVGTSSSASTPPPFASFRPQT